jgi:toxic protein SymE
MNEQPTKSRSMGEIKALMLLEQYVTSILNKLEQMPPAEEVKTKPGASPNGKRKLKIQASTRYREFRQAVLFPEIRLCGKWLKNAGFSCGQTVTVTHERNRIVIELQPE